MDYVTVFILASAILFAEGKPKHAYGYLIAGTLIFLALFLGVK